MSRRLLTAVILALPLMMAAAKEPSMNTPPTPEIVAGLVEITPPAGWAKTTYANSGGADTLLAFEHGADRIVIQVFGAKGSFNRTPEDFLAGPGATTMGRSPERKGQASVAGRRVTIFFRRFPLLEGGPHDSTPVKPMMGTEYFCVLPPARDRRFVVFSLRRESPIPDIDRTGEKSWDAFLRAARAPKRGKKKGM